jgi:hypothetical protein
MKNNNSSHSGLLPFLFATLMILLLICCWHLLFPFAAITFVMGTTLWLLFFLFAGTSLAGIAFCFLFTGFWIMLWGTICLIGIIITIALFPMILPLLLPFAIVLLIVALLTHARRYRSRPTKSKK